MNVPKSVRPWLVLGRISNLPTVWSNCFAGWLLGGGGTAWGRLALLCGGATCLYLGGMFLNDAFDARFDAQHRRGRPIPSGAVPVSAVWRAGVVLLLLGVLALCPLGLLATLLALTLCGCIVVYDAIHKMVTFSSAVMGFCRFLLYPLAATAASRGAVDGAAVWSGLAMACYVAGLTEIARKETSRNQVALWPLIFLALPVGLALLVNDGDHWQPAFLVSLILVLWSARALRSAFSEPRNVGRSVAGLLAGIVWVDLLAVANIPREFAAVFLVLFVLTLALQRFIPAT